MRSPFTTLRYYLFLICLLAGFSWACTNFCMDTPDGPFFGSNMDLLFPGDGLVFINHRGVEKESLPSQAGTTGQTAKWTSKYGSVTFDLLGREFAWGGMNEAGLVIGTMELRASEFPPKDERPGFSIPHWVQYTLDTCGSVAEAIKVDAKIRIEDAVPNHFLIADAQGNCAAIEWLDGKYVCYTGDQAPVKAMSNMPYARALAALERGGPRWWWSNPGQSAERFAGAHQRSIDYDAAKDPDTVKYVFGTLVDVVAAPHTKWSIVYDIANREIWYGSAVSRPAKHISFKNLDFACDGPLLMLDVNAPLEGDVEKHFTPYDHDVNLNVFRTFCARYEIEISEQDANAIMTHFEAYPCAENAVETDSKD